MLYQEMGDVLTFLSLMKEIWSIIKLKRVTPKVLCSFFEKIATFYEENQGVTSLTFSLKMQTRTKHIPITYHKFHILLRKMMY